MSEEKKVEIPEWAWEFHGHICPFMPIGYRMGVLAMQKLDIRKIKDHGAYAFSEMGTGHPQTCMIDGVMIATGCTYGKLMMERLGYGKAASILYVPSKGAVRVYLRSEFQEELGKEEFFTFRKKGIEPSDIPAEITKRAVNIVLVTSDSDMFKVDMLPDFTFDRPKGSFAKVKCSNCQEYVFERYIRTVNGKSLCIPCTGYTQTWVNVLKGVS